jgi:ABC-2 type transport system permease protein
MITDMLTVVWKEYREIFRGPGSRFNMLMVIFSVALVGVLLPAQQGAGFVTSPIMLLYCAWIPMLMVPTVVADSFAGERERHTLETLLAGRLSDRAILFGKLCAIVLYAWGLTLLGLLMGLITVNVLAAAGGHLLLFPALLALSAVTMSFLSSWLFAGLGVLISLRSPTVQKAQQTLAAVTLLPMAPLIALPLLLGDEKLGALLTGVVSRLLSHVPVVVGMAMLLLLVSDLALAWISLARFQRARLILD